MVNDFGTNNWNSIKRDLQKAYPELTNADLLWRGGTQKDVLQMIADKLGISRKEVEAKIDKK